MIPHTHHTWPSGNVTTPDPVQSAAERCGRQEVCPEWYATVGVFHDLVLFRWLEGQDELNLDPWRLIDDFGYSYRPGMRIFVQVRDLEKNNLMPVAEIAS